MAVDGGVDGADLAALSRWLRSEQPAIAKELRRSIRDAAKPVLAAERAAVKALTFTSTPVGGGEARAAARPASGGGSAARAAARGTTSLAVAVSSGARLLSAKQAPRVRRGAGLRDTIARGMRITYADRGAEAKATVRTSASAMPADQRNLPRLVNFGRWRHPVFADAVRQTRKEWTWVYQSPSRVGWWWVTAEGEAPAALVRMERGLADIEQAVAAAARLAARGGA